MEISAKEKMVDELLSRSIVEILPDRAALKERLMSDERLRFYIGTDATGTSLHLGHATNYMLLEKIRRLGHEVIFLIGDFTSRIGDPTDKDDSARRQLTRDEVVANTKTWLDQVRPIIDIDNLENPVKIMFNHEWLSKLTFEDIINIAANFTVQHMIERDMFEKRMAAGKPLYLHELFYPLMQGYDSVVMAVDAEVCGNDQKFNALAGRTLLRKLKNKEKFVIVTTLLENPITKEKMMSKSQGTGVFLDFDPATMYGAVMAQPDENMPQLFLDCTWLTRAEIQEILDQAEPRDAKMKLAQTITSIYHGAEAAAVAEAEFIKTFQQGGAPEDLIEISGDYLAEIIKHELVSSRSAWQRLLQAGAVKDLASGAKLSALPEQVSEPTIIKIGKRRFVKLLP